ncbi:hypothetical protein EOJ36_10725 [Sandaracinomonas limnophila]|uniref:Long-chain fatty acid transport protein n=1 Tax=Sandaracinomonas limnophila TaxID=1862386 RepID=A0A437PNB4_9BACT|nr:hypothetical protein [Sandaracinomonas limnophila]RVU23544.1 hypothetical protein EOJ36_10725 [Sandaracinomonas limnophila]
MILDFRIKLNTKAALGIFFLFIANLFTFQGFSQTILNSPYSYIGLGEVDQNVAPSQVGMGGIGVATSNGIYINTQNPALLARNRYTVFEAGANVERKTMQDLRQSQRLFGGNYKYLALLLPVSSRWTMSFSLSPYSTIQYETKSFRRLNVLGLDSLIYNYSGQGNISKLGISNGVRIGKGVYLGLETNVLFGNVIRSVGTQNMSDGQYYKVQLEKRMDYAGLTFKGGAAYQTKVGKDLFLTLGTTLDLTSQSNATEISRFVIYDLGGLNVINADTVGKSTPFTQHLPVTTKFGVSLEKAANWTIGIDYSMTDWSKIDNFLGNSATLPKTYKVAVGAELTPDFEAVSNYFKRISYRAGFNYATTPYSILNSGKFATEMNLTLGIGFPLRNLSYFNLSYQLGKRGDITNQGLEEQFHRLTIGLTLSDLWFVKQRIN